MELFRLTIHELRDLLAKKEVSSVQVAQSFLVRLGIVEERVVRTPLAQITSLMARGMPASGGILSFRACMSPNFLAKASAIRGVRVLKAWMRSSTWPMRTKKFWTTSTGDTSFDGPGEAYMFWDGLHGTSHFQALVSDWTFEALTNAVLERVSAQLSQGRAQLSIQMNYLQIGRAYTLQSTADFGAWQDVATWTATAGTNQWTSSTKAVPAFYRLKWQH